MSHQQKINLKTQIQTPSTSYRILTFQKDHRVTFPISDHNIQYQCYQKRQDGNLAVVRYEQNEWLCALQDIH